ncbi:hypothetical protein CR513_29261, partial [Mucuna pruriens]
MREKKERRTWQPKGTVRPKDPERPKKKVDKKKKKMTKERKWGRCCGLKRLNFHHDVAILCRPYLELQTSKMNYLYGSRKLRQRSTIALFCTQPSSTAFNVKSSRNTQQFGVRESIASRVVNEFNRDRVGTLSPRDQDTLTI